MASWVTNAALILTAAFRGTAGVPLWINWEANELIYSSQFITQKDGNLYNTIAQDFASDIYELEPIEELTMWIFDGTGWNDNEIYFYFEDRGINNPSFFMFGFKMVLLFALMALVYLTVWGILTLCGFCCCFFTSQSGKKTFWKINAHF